MSDASKLGLRNRSRHARTCRGKVNALSGILALACLVFLQLLAACGGGGSGGSGGSPPPPSGNPVPAIVSLNPNSANVGGAAFTLTIAGQNFISSSAVQWNGSPRTTTFSSSTELQAQITAADIAAAGSGAVSVVNPAPGGGNSGSAEFAISASSNPMPLLGSLSPSSIDAGSSGFILTVSGANFIPTSTIQWNGSALPTTYLSGTQLEAQIPGADIAASGFAEVAVVNPAPGGGASSPRLFSIATVPMIVSQGANDLVWDPMHQLIYLSVPSLAASNGNTVAALNPVTGSIQSSQFAGSEPDVLAISDDNQYLYAALDGASSVQRFTLPGLVPDITYSLGAVPTFGPTFAMDLQVAPSLAHTTAVSRGVFNTSVSALGGVEIYDDAILRPTIADVPGALYDSLQWGSDTTIYANNGEVASLDLYVLTASAGGVVQSGDYPNEFSSFFISIHYDSGTKLVYGDDGSVINPANGQRVGAFPASGLMTLDSTLKRAFFLGQTAAQSGTGNFAIASFDLTTFVPVAEIVVTNVRGNPQHLIRWGTNGLAFNDDAGYVYVLNSPFVAADGTPVVTPRRYFSPLVKAKPAPKAALSWQGIGHHGLRPNPSSRTQAHASAVANPAPAITALSPSTVVAGVNGFTLTVTGSSFVSQSTIEWNGSPRPTEYVSSGELQAQISSSDVGTASSISISVTTPVPGGGSSKCSAVRRGFSKFQHRCIHTGALSKLGCRWELGIHAQGEWRKFQCVKRSRMEWSSEVEFSGRSGFFGSAD